MEPRSKSPEKARRAATDPARPGQACKAAPGTFHPVVERSRCEGKEECVEVCPYTVFEVRRIDEAEYRGLSLLGKLKLRVHGMQTSYTPNAADCHACGLCVVACPEHAIRLQRAP